MSSWLRISRFFLYVQVMFPWMIGGVHDVYIRTSRLKYLTHNTCVFSVVCVPPPTFTFNVWAVRTGKRREKARWRLIHIFWTFLLLSHPLQLYLFVFLLPLLLVRFYLLIPPTLSLFFPPPPFSLFSFHLIFASSYYYFFFRFHVFAFPQHYFSTCNHREVRALLQAILNIRIINCHIAFSFIEKKLII